MIDAPIQQETRISLEEFFLMADEQLQCLLVDGEFIQMPPPSLKHQSLLGRIYAILLGKANSGSLWISPVSFVLSERTIVQPDIAWVGPQSAVQDDRGKRFIGAPDLAIEILSPGTARYDRQTKYALYERYGTREYWLVDAEEGFVEVYMRDALDATRFIRLGVYGEGESFPSAALGQPVTLTGLFEVAAPPPAEAPASPEASAAAPSAVEPGQADA